MSRDLLRRLMIVLALLMPVPAAAAGFSCAKPGESGGRSRSNDAEEPAIRASEATTRATDMQAWLSRWPGKYVYAGHVDLCGKGKPEDQRPVTGKADCIAAGSSASPVHCRIDVSWPAQTGDDGAPVLGGVSPLAPAQFVLGIESPLSPMPLVRGVAGNGWGLVFLQLDNSGVPEWASGALVGDTFISKERCVGIPGQCNKTTRITAKPGSNEISMTVDIVINRERVLRQAFLLQRSSAVRNSAQAPGWAP